MPANFPMLLAELKRKNSMTVLKKYYQDEWEFYDLLIGLTNHEDFKQACIDKSFSKDFKNDLDHYIKLTNQAREAISKYFKRKDIELQAYYTKTNGALNINLINYDRSEPIKISDILQQEKNISELNIYCNKKHDIHAYRKDKERHYEFTKGAYYEMTSTWPADKSGKTFMCTMVMNVSNDGITKIVEFNGKKFNDESDKLLSEEDMKLIEQNKELYIQGLSLYDAVKALLERNKNAPLPDVVLTANNNSQNKEPTSVNRDEKLEEQKAVVLPDVVLNGPIQDEKVGGQLDLKNNAPRFPANNDTSTQIETDKRIAELERQNNDSQNILERAKQTIEELNKQNNSLQDKLEMEEKKHEKLQAGLKRKDEKLTSISANLHEKAQEFKNVCKEKEDLKEKLTSKLKELQNELNELKKKNCNLEDELDQLKRSNEKKGEEEQLLPWISDLKETLLSLQKELLLSEEEKQALGSELGNTKAEKDKLNKELIEADQRIAELEEQKDSLQAKLAQKNEEFASISANLHEKAQELESARKEKEDLKKKLEAANAKAQGLESELEGRKKDAEKAEQIIEQNCQQKKRLDSLMRKVEELENELESERKQKGQSWLEMEEIVIENTTQLYRSMKARSRN